MPAGYSGTPLWKKIGFKPGMKAIVVNPPHNYDDLVAPLPDGVDMKTRLAGKFELIHFFAASESVLAGRIDKLEAAIDDGGMLWISWPKKSSPLFRDLTEDTIRAIVFANHKNLVDVKVCAVDNDWSGLKFVRRRR